MKIKLSILIYSLANGGAERVVSILLQELKEDYDITLFLMNKTIFYKIPQGLKIIYLDDVQERENGLKKLYKIFLLAWKYKKLNKNSLSLSFLSRPNYINILAKFLGMKSKIIISERSMPSLQYQDSLIGFTNKLLMKNLYKYADDIIANSLGNKQDLNRNFGCNNVISIYNPFDIEEIKKLSDETIELKKTKFTFISIGRLDKGKNHRLMIEALQEIDANLWLIGDGPLKEELSSYIKKFHLEKKVFLLGIKTNPFAYLSKADSFIFSSNHEGFPNVLVEALCCGLPVISTDCKSGPREILAPQTKVNFQVKEGIELAQYGILTPPNDKIQLLEAMKLMMSDDNIRQAYAQKALLRAKEFQLEKTIQQYKEILCVE
jgi:N-acetylgalactosamine-N,N'-diacetylbacillosaminyl-diphospho-undecaprenol 4-alpha-N-acetylgalactosaminyltransferase